MKKNSTLMNTDKRTLLFIGFGVRAFRRKARRKR